MQEISSYSHNSSGNLASMTQHTARRKHTESRDSLLLSGTAALTVTAWVTAVGVVRTYVLLVSGGFLGAEGPAGITMPQHTLKFTWIIC